MVDSIRVVVTNNDLQTELLSAAPKEFNAAPAPSEHGFGETLYPILLTAGVATLPVGILSGMIANWIGDTLKARKAEQSETIGVEVGGKIEALTLTEVDVDLIAQRIVVLLEQNQSDDQPG